MRERDQNNFVYLGYFVKRSDKSTTISGITKNLHLFSQVFSLTKVVPTFSKLWSLCLNKRSQMFFGKTKALKG